MKSDTRDQNNLYIAFADKQRKGKQILQNTQSKNLDYAGVATANFISSYPIHENKLVVRRFLLPVLVVLDDSKCAGALRKCKGTSNKP